MDPAQSFGKVLRAARREKCLTQEALAHEAGVERNFVSLIERGVNQPTIRVLFRLSAALKIPASELIRQVEENLRGPRD